MRGCLSGPVSITVLYNSSGNRQDWVRFEKRAIIVKTIFTDIIVHLGAVPQQLKKAHQRRIMVYGAY